MNKVAREKMILINQGFVHAVVLRYREGPQIAQAEYADNLAETRRLLTFLLHMSRLDVGFNPDGSGGSDDYARPKLGRNLLEILSSNLEVVQRCFPALQDTIRLVGESANGQASLPALKTVHDETVAYLAELRTRLSGGEITAKQTEIQSEAETITLEHFIGYSKEVDQRWRETLAPRKEEEFRDLITGLNSLLMNEFLAIEQLLIHGFVFQRWGLHATAERCFWQSVEEMRAAFRISQVILVLGGDPGQMRSEPHLIPHRVAVGRNKEEALSNDLLLMEQLIAAETSLADAANADTGATETLVSIVRRHTSYRDWLTARLTQCGDPASEERFEQEKNGSLEAMLARWNVK
ncbi:ferritin-like domain-containing protein [Mesorhizobium sp.]|uniref:ferritin-like domain-containing protein n=1 Tax=Mesorhizobium sp. TaxID=1871066 RepID=UPI00257D0A0C|nr:ferritin-like domain-containing protein [Mesorhizobium sp.]